MTPDEARQLDAQDPLRTSRRAFDLPAGLIYLDGNSLGALPHRVRQVMADVIADEWGRDLIRSWNSHDWINLPLTTGDRIGSIIGAAPGQVICTDSTSVNLFKLLAAALQHQQGRSVILSQTDNFPTDLYMAEGLARLTGEAVRLTTVAAEALSQALSDDVAVLMLTHVNFRDGRIHDLPGLTRAAHDAGALVLWDLSHSAGVLPLALDEHQVDLAVGCGYKYLNGGPGAPAWLYVNHALQGRIHQPLSGWMGHARPFDFSPTYEPATGISRFLSGTPGILSMKALEAALDLYADVSIDAVRQKSMQLTGVFVRQVASLPGVTLASPEDPELRGSQVSLQHPDAYAIVQALIERGVIGDFREPDLMRFGFAPLYNSFEEVWTAAGILAEIIGSGSYREPRFQERRQVT